MIADISIKSTLTWWQSPSCNRRLRDGDFLVQRGPNDYSSRLNDEWGPERYSGCGNNMSMPILSQSLGQFRLWFHKDAGAAGPFELPGL
jgi:hypothetical protein